MRLNLIYLPTLLFSTDLEPPKIASCPDDIKIISTAQWYKLMLPAVTVTDNVGVHLFTTNAVNGSEVTWGEYNITYTAKDKAGNAAYCRFLITVAGMYVLYAYLENKKPVIPQEVRVQARSRLL